MLIHNRYLWCLRRRCRIRFAQIEAITYAYEDWAMGALLSRSRNSADIFAVGLRLLDGEELGLFHFFGDGTFTNEGPWPDWFYWDKFRYDLSGTQEQESRAFVDVLSKMMDVPVTSTRA